MARRIIWLGLAANFTASLMDLLAVAFLGRAPVSAIWEINATEYTIKVLLTLLGTPVTYLLVGWTRSASLNFSRKLPKQR
ncbi:MAG TPA: hypothetical protein ENN00_00650 [Bacillaceae bacterium]|nr:hypothetical protein [Bacillaceae bacterium]